MSVPLLITSHSLIVMSTVEEVGRGCPLIDIRRGLIPFSRGSGVEICTWSKMCFVLWVVPQI